MTVYGTAASANHSVFDCLIQELIKRNGNRTALRASSLIRHSGFVIRAYASEVTLLDELH